MGRLKPPVNWSQQMMNFIDSYPLDSIIGVNPDTALAHAVQKDAIQNSLDAMDPNNPDDFRVEFRIDGLVDPKYISITDEGTTGLTGRPSLTRSELERLNKEQYRKENWSRMQALGYRNPDEDAIGARGQGKFIFIGASESREMLFDTLRADGIYRIGHWETNKNDPLMEPLEGEEAKNYLKSYLGIAPLERVGTRIIIPKPKAEAWNAFWGIFGENGINLDSYISSTWWESLRNGKTITMKSGDDSRDEKRVEPPKIYQHFWSDPDRFKYMRQTRVGKPFQKNFPSCVVEEIVIVYSEERVPEYLRGIAVQRGEMTIERFDPLHGNPHLPQSLKTHIFGWLIFNREGDRELKKTETSSHYRFAQKHGSLALEVLGRNGWLSKQMEQFGEELGFVAGGRNLTGMYGEVMNFLNIIARDLGYAERTRHGGPIKRKEEEKEEEEEIMRKSKWYLKARLRADYPTPRSRRVEFGEEISEVKARVSNYSDIPQEYHLEVALKKKEGFRRENEKEIMVFVKKDSTLPPKEKTGWFGPWEIPFQKGVYNEGTYVISALVTNPKTGKTIDEMRKLIYLNTDPPLEAGIFSELSLKALEPPDNKLQWRTRMTIEHKYELILNDAHPLFELNSEMKRGLKKKEPTKEYVRNCGLDALFDIDLKGRGYIVEKLGLNTIKELREKNFEPFENTLYETSRARQEFLFNAYRKK